MRGPSVDTDAKAAWYTGAVNTASKDTGNGESIPQSLFLLTLPSPRPNSQRPMGKGTSGTETNVVGARRNGLVN